MVIILHELKWLPLLSHAKAENKISARPKMLPWRKKWRKTFLSSKANWQTVSQTKKKNEAWQKLADVVNAVGVANRTAAEIREKWKNLHSQAKKEFTVLSKEQKKTGGGPVPKMPSAAAAKIIDLFKDTPSFTGLDGFESKGSDFSTSLIFFSPCLRHIKNT